MAYEDRLMESERAGNYLDTVAEPYGGIDDMPGTYTDFALEGIDRYFPELDPHIGFNEFIGAQQKPNLTTKEYNVLGGMNIADLIQPGEKKLGYDWSDPYSLSALGGIYGVVDKLEQGEDQSWRETFGDWYRNMKGIGIQRDFNPLGLLYDENEADYYKGLYEKFQKDYKKDQLAMEKSRVNKMLMEIGGGRTFAPSDPRPGPRPGGWSPSGADLSPGGGYGQSPTGRDVQGTPFSRGGILGAF